MPVLDSNEAHTKIVNESKNQTYRRFCSPTFNFISIEAKNIKFIGYENRI